MGYCGLDHWTDVDGASDLHVLLNLNKSENTKFFEIVHEQIEYKGNDFNPCGSVNLALLIEAGEIKPAELGRRNLFAILDKITCLMEQVNDDFHDKAYLRLYRVIKKSLNQTRN